MGGPYSPAGPPPSQRPYPGRRRSVVWPSILIGLGIILLLQNFGLLSWSMWASLWRFWPLILVLIGLELFLQGSARALVGLLLGALLVLALVAVATTSMVDSRAMSGRARWGSSDHSTAR